MKTVSILKYPSLIVLAALVGCKGNTTAEVVDSSSKALVKVATATTNLVDQTYEYSGTVEAFKLNNISSSMPLRIDKINVEVGDAVKKGQVLAAMDRSQYNQALTQLQTYQLELKRIENLLKAGALPQRDYDNMKAQVDISQTVVGNLKENMQLTSPIDGIVTARNYDEGDMTGADPVLTVAQMQPVKILINVQEIFYPKIKKGEKVNLKLDVYPDQLFEGTVYLVHPTVNQTTRTFVAEVRLPNSNMAIKPGMFARVEATFDKVPRVIIPDQSVQKQEGSNERFVFVVENGVARRRVVELGRRLGDMFEVISGVNDNDRVVTAGQVRLLDKTEVEIQD